MYLLGNVIDKEEERIITKEQAMDAAHFHGFSAYMETSAKTGEGIEPAFLTATKHIYHLHEDHLHEFVSQITLRLTMTSENPSLARLRVNTRKP